MKEGTGVTHVENVYASVMAVADSKAGKTCGIIGNVLGAMPGQESGIVTEPKNLHVIAVDEGAIDGVRGFLKESCKANEATLGYRVYNMEEDFKKVFAKDSGYSQDFYNELMGTIDKIVGRIAQEGGVHVLHISSLTMAANAIMRGLFGAPLSVQGKSSADINKRYQFGNVMSELQNFAQQGLMHVIWEAHLYNKVKDGGGQEESLSIEGKTGSRFTGQVRFVTRLRRMVGTTYPGTRVDKVTFDTRPSLAFNANGRAFTERLDNAENDLTTMFKKLGLAVGGWKAK